MLTRSTSLAPHDPLAVDRSGGDTESVRGVDVVLAALAVGGVTWPVSVVRGDGKVARLALQGGALVGLPPAFNSRSP